MKKVLLFVFALTYISLGFCQENAPQKILFVGNSYTYFWNLPQLVAAMADTSGVELETRQSTAGGSNWGMHWRGERALHTRERIQQGDFDIVILQNHSRRTLNGLDSMLLYGERLNALAKQSGAKVYLYQTWARAWNPPMQDTITDGYAELGERIDAEIVPVGEAWELARTRKPDFPLYDPDQSHPSPLGTYLTACVFYGALTGNSPVGLPHRLTTQDRNGEKLYLNIQSKERAAFCQKIAAEVLGL